LKPDLIILDLSLPDLSGWDVAKTVRESLPAVPILLLTAHGGSPMIEEIRRRGLQGYVSKSEADTTLLAAIDAILHLKQGFFPTN
jgi:DNA-binding NarL/FixJ family response regulator